MIKCATASFPWFGPRGADGDPPKTFNQDEVNQIVQDRLAKEKEKNRPTEEANRKLLIQLEELQTNFKGTKEQNDAFMSELEELRKRTLTQTEIEKREEEKARKKYEADLKTAQETGSRWESRFRGLQFGTDVTAAAIEHGVMPASIPLLEAFLRNTSAVIVDDDGVRTEVEFDDVGADGKPIKAKMTVGEAVKRMKDMPDKWGNLFTAYLKAGLGGGSGKGGSGNPDANTPQALNALPMDQFLAKRRKDK